MTMLQTVGGPGGARALHVPLRSASRLESPDSGRRRGRRPVSSPALWKLVLIVGLTGGCGDRSGGAATPEGVTTTFDTIGGVVHARSTGAAPAWTAEPMLRLGSVEGGADEFGRIRSLLADGEGNVYVADNLAHEIRVFSPDGSHLRSIGRDGAGPGEFGDLYSLAWLDGDLAAMDPRNARIGILTTDGEWLDGIRHYPITGAPSHIRLHPLAEAGFYAPVVDPAHRRLPFVRFTAAGPADTIPFPEPPADAPQSGVVCHRPDGGITGISIPQAPVVVYGFPPPGGSLAVAWTESYRVAFVGSDGDTVLIVSREAPPLPYPDSLWTEAVKPYRELQESFPGSTCEPGAPERPRHLAALRHLTFDDGGRMWVEASAPGGFVWEVFDRDGRLLGAAPAPPRAPGIPPYVRDGRLYQVETDEMDVQYVAVYAIHP